MGSLTLVCDAPGNKGNAFPLLLDISRYVTSWGLDSPIMSDAVDCVTSGGYTDEDGRKW